MADETKKSTKATQEAQGAQLPEIDLTKFSVKGDFPLKISLPNETNYTEADVDAQLFSYVMDSDDKKIQSINDLTDEWVKENFPDIDTVAALREVIKFELAKKNKEDISATKFQRCADALISQLEGEIPDEVLEPYVEASRQEYGRKLAMQGMTRASYMAQEGISSAEFEQRMHDDVLFQLKLNVALNVLAKEAAAAGADIPLEDLTKYLQVRDPDNFVNEVTETGKIEEAKQAALRIKIMRDLIDQAEIRFED